jgi:rare lipoprotein A
MNGLPLGSLAVAVVMSLSPVSPAGCRNPFNPPANSSSSSWGAGPATTCRASYYGGPGDNSVGSKTASGQKFNFKAMTAAHRKMAFGTKVRVTNPKNRKSVTVVINDRGPAAWTGRCIDLTYAAFGKIANRKHGEVTVKVQVVSKPKKKR